MMKKIIILVYLFISLNSFASVSDGEPATAAVFNASFASREIDTDFAGIATFLNFAIFDNQTATTVPYLNASKQLVSSAVTPTELGYLSGVTSALQTQIDLKANDNEVVHLTGNEVIAGIKNFTENVRLSNETADRAPVINGTNDVVASSVTGTEQGYLSGVTSAIQTQINSKANDADVVKLTGNQTVAGEKTFSSAVKINSYIEADETATPATPASTKGRCYFKSTSKAWACVDDAGSETVYGTATPPLPTVVTKTTTYTATTDDAYILVDTSGGAWTLTLYAASGNAGRTLKIIKTTTDFTALTVDANASETINGSLTTSANTDGETLELLCDGTNWIIKSRKSGLSRTSYTPTFTGWGTVTGTTMKYWRVGDTLHVHGYTNTGTPTAVTARVSIPSGLNVDTAKIENTDQTTVGLYWINNTTASHGGPLLYDPGTTGSVAIGGVSTFDSSGAGAGAFNAVSPQLGSTQLGTGIGYIIHFSVPISGWKGSNE